MLMECKAGLIRPNTKESGSTTRQTARVNFGVRMATHTKAIGRMIKRMALAPSSLKMAKSATLANGRTICITVRALRAGLTDRALTVTLKKARRMALELTSGQMAHSTQATGSITRWRAKALISG